MMRRATIPFGTIPSLNRPISLPLWPAILNLLKQPIFGPTARPLNSESMLITPLLRSVNLRLVR